VDTDQIILAVGTAVLVVFSLTVALVVPKRNPDFPGRRLGMFLGVCATLVVGMLLLVGFFGSEDAEHEAEAAVAETAPAEGGESAPPAETGAPSEGGGGGGAPAGDAAAGEAIFASAGCAGCHTLAAAGASGTVGPNLDDAKPPYELVIEFVTNGAGAMPSFAGQLSEQQIQDVAAYVVQATSG
jgi:mono/diheme cytochrome c family protein